MDNCPEYIKDFLNSVYPGSANLALEMFNEKTCIKDATAEIKRLKAELRVRVQTAADVLARLNQAERAYKEITAENMDLRARCGEIGESLDESNTDDLCGNILAAAMTRGKCTKQLREISEGREE